MERGFRSLLFRLMERSNDVFLKHQGTFLNILVINIRSRNCISIRKIKNLLSNFFYYKYINQFYNNLSNKYKFFYLEKILIKLLLILYLFFKFINSIIFMKMIFKICLINISS